MQHASCKATVCTWTIVQRLGSQLATLESHSPPFGPGYHLLLTTGPGESTGERHSCGILALCLDADGLRSPRGSMLVHPLLPRGRTPWPWTVVRSWACLLMPTVLTL